MNTSIKATNMELTDAIRTAIQEKMDKLDNKTERFGGAVTAEVEVGRTTQHHKNGGELFRAEVHVRLPKDLVYAESSDKDLYVAIKKAADEAERQILVHKSKLIDGKKRQGGRNKE